MKHGRVRLQAWDKDLNFSDQTVGEVKSKESSLLAYFGEVKAVLRLMGASTS